MRIEVSEIKFSQNINRVFQSRTRGYKGLTSKIIKLPEEDPGWSVKNLVRKLGINRTYLVGCPNALENQGYVKLKRIRSTKVYFILISR